MNYKQSVKVAKIEGRVCECCGWVVTKKRWKMGIHICGNCEDAKRGVNCHGGYGRYFDEPGEKTGEM